MIKQKNIISPKGCVHTKSPKEDKLLCNHGGYRSSYVNTSRHGWLHTERPVTCKRCISVMNRKKSIVELKRCLTRIAKLESVIKSRIRLMTRLNKLHIAEMGRFNGELRSMCKYYEGHTDNYVYRFKCTHEDNPFSCCITHCPLRREINTTSA